MFFKIQNFIAQNFIFYINLLSAFILHLNLLDFLIYGIKFHLTEVLEQPGGASHKHV